MTHLEARPMRIPLDVRLLEIGRRFTAALPAWRLAYSAHLRDPDDEAAAEHNERHLSALHRLSHEASQIMAATPAGLAVKARLRLWDLGLAPATRPDAENPLAAALVDLAAEIEAVAGLE